MQLFHAMVNDRALILKICLFVTGCAGIVAEFVLSTLATYLIGNAIFQWTIVMSLMLFAMGLGSRFSRLVRRNLLDAFILIEFCLSILCAVSALLTYTLAAFLSNISLFVYVLALIIGCLIGLEIPLVTRLNDAYEELRINISNVMEKDYYGALLGGLVFAFLALPNLGLTYTPIVLGSLNFMVATILLWRFYEFIEQGRLLITACLISFILLISLAFLAKPIILYGEQVKYKDKVIYSGQTAYQKIVMTRWRQYYWLYINGQEQFSTFDEEKYHEPLVHPALKLSSDHAHILILGGGDGLALREVLKYPAVQTVTLVDLDPVMTDLARNHPVLRHINQGAMADPKVIVKNMDAAVFLEKHPETRYGAIIIDLPDPDSIDLMHLYSQRFYRNLKYHLTRGGVVVTQATSPVFSNKAFLCIQKTFQSAGYTTLAYHNSIPTMGEWGWVLGVVSNDCRSDQLKQRLMAADFSDVKTRYVNHDAMVAMLHFGKGILENTESEKIDINLEISPVLHRYYLSGASWNFY
jgi:spermidine synthase